MSAGGEGATKISALFITGLGQVAGEPCRGYKARLALKVLLSTKRNYHVRR